MWLLKLLTIPYSTYNTTHSLHAMRDTYDTNSAIVQENKGGGDVVVNFN